MMAAGWLKRLTLRRGQSGGRGDLSAAMPADLEKREADPGRLGVALLDAGRLLEAVEAFRSAVAAAPGTADNYVNLAYALQQTGEAQEAFRVLKSALEADASNVDAHYMLAIALEQQGDVSEAIRHLKLALALRGDFEPAHGQLCRLLATSGQFEDAALAIEAALLSNPSNAEFHLYAGNLHLTRGHVGDAIASFECALARRPQLAEAHANLGSALQIQGDLDVAAQHLEHAIDIQPSFDDAVIRLVAIRKAQNKLEAAAAVLQRLIGAKPDHAEAYNQLGVVRKEQGLLDEAIVSYRRAVELQPNQPGAYGNLGLALDEQGKSTEAVAIYRRGLATRPTATIHDNLGIALQRQGKVDEAIEQYRLAIALDPDNVNTRCNLSAALADGNAPREAIVAYREILAMKPDHLVAHSNLLFSLCYDETVSPEAYLAEARAFNAKLDRGDLRPVTVDVQAGRSRPLRVGLVSGDLRGHPVGYFLEGMLHHLDASRIRLYAYSTQPTEDSLTARIRPRFSSWRMIKNQTDESAARSIREDGIDILIDLAGHTGNNRLAIFARRPAPLQLSWLGYFASTGVSAIDYVLADSNCVPPGAERYFTERIWRLPETRLCYTEPQVPAPDVALLPALRSGQVTFGCFQRLPKLNDGVLALWSRVFAALPQARLLLQCPQFAKPRLVDETLKRLASAGIEPSRVTARQAVQREAYMASYGDVDIVLDTYPYTGGTTTCDALWMGVPTLTLAGDTMLERQGAALMTAAGLSEWVADNQDDFVRRAVGLTRDLDQLARLRMGLRARAAASPLFDAPRFARHFESGLLDLWLASMQDADRRSP